MALTVRPDMNGTAKSKKMDSNAVSHRPSTLVHEDLVTAETFDVEAYDNQHGGRFSRTKFVFSPLFMYCLFGLLLLLFIALAVWYFHGIRYYSSHFYPHTFIGTVDVSGMTVDEAEKAMAFDDYSLHVHFKYGDIDFESRDFKAELELYPSVSSLLERQGSVGWLFASGKSHVLDSDIIVRYDKDWLAESVRVRLKYLEQQSAIQNSSVQLSDDGHLSFVTNVVQEVMSYDAVIAEIDDAVQHHLPSLDLSSNVFYRQASDNEDADNLRKLTRQWNQLVDVGGTYEIDGKQFSISGYDLARHLRLSDSQVHVDVNKGYLIDVFCKETGFSVEDLISDGFGEDVVFSYLSDVASVMAGGLNSKDTTVLPSFSIDGLTSIDEWAIQISLNTNNLYLYYNGKVDSTYSLLKNSAVKWKNYPSCVMSVDVKDDSLVLSNGLTIGENKADFDFGIQNMYLLLSRLHDNMPAYVVYVASGSNEKAAWNNVQLSEAETVDFVLPDWKDDWLQVS